MGVDLGGPAVEVAIGLAFVFFLLSTVVSTITEGIAWLTKQRARKLEQGFLGLLGDNKIAKEVLDHTLVQSDARKPAWWRRKQKPSYVSARNFSLALIDRLGKRGAASDDPLKNVENGVEDLGSDTDALRAQLTALFGDPAVKTVEDFRKAAEKWFDDGMDRVSGWYRRWAQLIACVLAVLVTIGFNVNAIKITESLANEPTVRAAVVAQAESSAGASDATSAGKGAEEAVNKLEALKLPILWNDATDDLKWSLIAGWLLTAIAISLGSPFWFDALSKLAHLRTSGKKPDPKLEGAG
jgi:hypothetical protein